MAYARLIHDVEGIVSGALTSDINALGRGVRERANAYVKERIAGRAACALPMLLLEGASAVEPVTLAPTCTRVTLAITIGREY